MNALTIKVIITLHLLQNITLFSDHSGHAVRFCYFCHSEVGAQTSRC